MLYIHGRFPSMSFFPRTCVREAKAKLAFRTPKVHPDDELYVSFQRNIRNMREWMSIGLLVCSHTIEKKPNFSAASLSPL